MLHTKKISSTNELNKLSLTLQDLSDHACWVAYREEVRSGQSGLSKVPYSPVTGRMAKANTPSTWGSRHAAETLCERLADGRKSGIGINFTRLASDEGLRLGGVDLDGCLNPENGDLAPWATEVIARLGSYAEISPSGTGVHILFVCLEEVWRRLRDTLKMSEAGNASFSRGKHVEIGVFFSKKYFTVTEDRWVMRPG